jgi:diguanylate cyclase (GGDEF)-like protein
MQNTRPPNPSNPLAWGSFSISQQLDKVVLRLQALLASVVITPFSMWRIMQGQYQLAAIGLSAVVCLIGLGLFSFNARLFARASRYVMPLVVIAQVGAISGMVGVAGSETKTWMFPVIVASFLLLRAREATAISMLGAATQAWLAYQQTGQLRDSAIFMACCLLVVTFTHLFASRLHSDNLRLKTRSLQDPLTGVGNRRLLDDTLAELASQPQTLPRTLIMLDMDHFKSVNDRFGHNVGDVCLRRFASAVAGCLGPHDAVYRFGGEEFVVLAALEASEGAALAERIRHHIEQTPLIREARLTVSAGVASMRPGQTVRDWLALADTALYQAKEAGRNRVHSAPA